MSRIRTIKPDFFRHEELFEAEKQSKLPLRIAFAGLWTCCDREGRFRWKPRQLKLDILPYDDVEFSRVLDALMTRGFIVKYEVGTEVYGYIPSWNKHQVINNREKLSELPVPPNFLSEPPPDNPTNQNDEENQPPSPDDDASPTRDSHVSEIHERAQAEGERELEEEGKGNNILAPSDPQNDLKLAQQEAPSVFITIPLNDQTEFPITEIDIVELTGLYPAIDVRQKLRDLRGWNLANPKKRKTQSGIWRHIHNAMAEAQNRGGNVNNSKFQNQQESIHETKHETNQRNFKSKNSAAHSGFAEKDYGAGHVPKNWKNTDSANGDADIPM